MALTLEKHKINQKYAHYRQPLNQNIYQIIESRLGQSGKSLKSSKILDFGCNVGNLLHTAQGQIPFQNYTGIDIQPAALEQAQSHFPQARFIHYNKFNNTFNPHGNLAEKIPLQTDYDLIIAYGVFTHFFMDDIVSTLSDLKKLLSPNGQILFSVWEDVDFYGYLGFLDRELSLNVSLAKPVNFHKSITLVNRNQILVDQDAAESQNYDWIESFYCSSYLKNRLNCHKLEGTYSLHPVYTISGGFY